VRAFARAGAPLAVAALVAAGIVGVRTSRDDSAPTPPAIGPVATVHAEVARAEWNRLVEEKIEEAAAGSSCHSSVRGDFDADGGLDTALVYGTACKRLGPGKLRLIMADGTSIEQSLRSERVTRGGPAACLAGCAAFAATDIDGEGRDELALELDHGASQSFFGLFRLVGRRVARIPLSERGALVPITFGYYGSLCCASDALCRRRNGRAYVVDVSTGHNEFYTSSTADEYVYDGRVLRPSGSRWYYWPRRLTSHLVPGSRCFDEGRRLDGWPQFRRIYLDF
jgi:hypothetical protein